MLVRLDSTGTNALITWESGGGPVTSYAILPSGGQIQGPLDANTFTFSYQWTLVPGSPVPACTFVVRAYFANGTYADSTPVPVFSSALSSSITAVRGLAGLEYLCVSPAPSDLSSVRVCWEVWDDVLGNVYHSIELAGAAFNNGAAQLPLDQMTGYDAFTYLEAQCINTNGTRGALVGLWPYPVQAGEEGGWGTAAATTGFVDARPHLKENLRFLLRSATVSLPFSYASDLDTSGYATGVPHWDRLSSPQDYFVRPPVSTNYEYYGFHTYSPSLGYSFLDKVRPVQDDFIWRNLAFDPQAWTTIQAQTSLPPDAGEREVYSLSYIYSGSGIESPLPLALTNSAVPWLYFQGCPGIVDHVAVGAEVGCVSSGSGAFSLAAGTSNCFGLSLDSLRLDSQPGQVFLPGDALPDTYASSPVFYFPNFQVPILQTVDYYFASQTPYFNYFWDNYTQTGPAPPLPGSPTFSVTNTSPLLITGFGQPVTVSGWAKQAIANGYSGKFAYLEQYFDQAYTIDANGNVTTNSAGLLSPSGEFFPMQAGPAALVTMPDIDPPYQRGTGVVNVIKLQLDVNHDGIMDLSFTGPDNTSPDRPFSFWINNDHDEPGPPGNLDKDEPVPPNLPDYTYGAIRCQRNLEDFARLWVCGLPKLPPNQGYNVTLTMSPLSRYPTMNLYAVYGTNSGIGYLTDTNAATLQFRQEVLNGQVMFDYSKKVGTISPSQSYSLPFDSDGTPQFTNFLFEAAGTNGSGQLLLTVSQTTAQGSNVLAQTSAWLDFHDIKDFYEQALVTNVVQEWPEMVEQDPASGFQVFSYAKVNAGNASQLAAFVHGWRVPEPEYFMFAETMFKRLYWQGFQGRFAALRWPTRSADTDPFFHLDYVTYNRSEHIAFKSGTGAAAYLNGLRQRFPDYTISVCAHSMGNVVMMQTLEVLAAAGQAPIDNYVLMQAAVPAQCYDTAVTNHPLFTTLEQTIPTPNTYSNYAAETGTALRPGGQMVNFFNSADFALSIAWVANQGFDVGSSYGPVTMKPNTLLGYYTDGTSHLLRTNSWNQSLLSVLYRGFYSGPTRPVTNLDEMMPFVARPRSKAVGAQGGIQGQIQGEEVDLQAQFGFGGAASDHSGQWNRNIQDPAVGPFYFQLRESLFPPQP